MGKKKHLYKTGGDETQEAEVLGGRRDQQIWKRKKKCRRKRICEKQKDKRGGT